MSEQFVPQPDVTSDDKLWALLDYVLSPIVPIIVLLMEDKKNRPFLKAHTVQALVLGVVLWVLAGVLSWTCIAPFLALALEIYFGIQAYNGKMVNIPVISDFVRNQGWA